MKEGHTVTHILRRFFGSNSFCTTAHRMSRNIFDGAITAEDVIYLYKENKEAAK